MGKDLVTGALLLVSFLSPTPIQTDQILTPVIKIEDNFTYQVKEGDSLQKIAQEFYNSPDDWIVIWEDNKFITDPNVIEKDQKLKIRNKKPTNFTPSLELQKKLDSINNTIDNSQVAEAVITVNQTSTPSVTQIAPTPTVTPPSASLPSTSPSSLNEAQIEFLGNCESGMTATRNSGNGFYGAFQFTTGTWNHMGTGYERADLAPLEVQKDAVQRLLQRSSIYSQFPGCSAKMRSAGLL